MRTLTLVLSVVGALSLGTGPSFAQAIAPVDPLAYAQPQTLAALPDGRRIHLRCMGSGAPTVILTAGLGGSTESWRGIHAAIAAKTRTCAWDRPGFGFSGPSPRTQLVAQTSQDLAAALKAANIPGPYVLVGHSMGAYETLLFADRYPAQVAGIVLEDPSIPDQAARLPRAAPVFTAWTPPGRPERRGDRLRCVELLKAPPPGDAEAVENCLDWPPGTPDAVKAGQRPFRMDPARLPTQLSLRENFAASSRQVVNPARDYGATPMIVLTAGAPGEPEGMPPEVAADRVNFRTEWARAHAEYAALSSRGTRRIVEGAPHNIHGVKPQAVIDAVLEVVDAVRRPPPRP